MRWLFRPRKIRRASIRLSARSLALAEEHRFVCVDVKGKELPLDDQRAAVLRRIGIGCCGLDVSFVNRYQRDTPTETEVRLSRPREVNLRYAVTGYTQARALATHSKDMIAARHPHVNGPPGGYAVGGLIVPRTAEILTISARKA